LYVVLYTVLIVCCTLHCTYCNLLYFNRHLLQRRFQLYVVTQTVDLQQTLHTLQKSPRTWSVNSGRNMSVN